MTIYALDLEQVRSTIRDTLVAGVLPAVEGDAARGELLGVIEMLDNLESRLAWNPVPMKSAVSRTSTLGEALGRETGATDGDLDTLRTDRELIGEALAAAYTNGIDPAVVAAVAEFTAEDVLAEITVALRPGLPG